ncbi:MAG: hypothetical protein JSV75_01165 [Candidatus Bathyarchaeota archaeon]|nr:MAG: hypothetical protein JSV75_01165 [Candidatus Bathyarchaeota archaeon]
MAIKVQRKYARTNIFIVDKELWAWAQYKAKLLGFKSVSEYIFQLIIEEKEKGEATKRA